MEPLTISFLLWFFQLISDSIKIQLNVSYLYLNFWYMKMKRHFSVSGVKQKTIITCHHWIPHALQITSENIKVVFYTIPALLSNTAFKQCRAVYEKADWHTELSLQPNIKSSAKFLFNVKNCIVLFFTVPRNFNQNRNSSWNQMLSFNKCIFQIGGSLAYERDKFKFMPL